MGTDAHSLSTQRLNNLLFTEDHTRQVHPVFMLKKKIDAGFNRMYAVHSFIKKSPQIWYIDFLPRAPVFSS